jgi:hypothetical protein
MTSGRRSGAAEQLVERRRRNAFGFGIAEDHLAGSCHQVSGSSRTARSRPDAPIVVQRATHWRRQVIERHRVKSRHQHAIERADRRDEFVALMGFQSAAIRASIAGF